MSSRTRSRTALLGDGLSGSSSGAADGQSGGRLIAGQRIILAVKEEDESCRAVWRVEVPENVKERLRARQGYGIVFRPTVKSHASQAMRPTTPELAVLSLSIDWEGTRVNPESIQVPMRQDGVGSVTKSINEKSNEHARIEVMGGEDNQDSRVDSRNLEPPSKPLTRYLNGTRGWDGGIKRELVCMLWRPGVKSRLSRRG